MRDLPVAAGRFLKPFGVRGEIRFKPHYPGLIYPEDLAEGYASSDPDRREIEVAIEAARDAHKYWVLKVKGYTTPEDVSRLTNRDLFIMRSSIPDPEEGEFFDEELTGLAVADEAGADLGRITGVIHTPANDVWEVAMPDGRELLLPAIPQVVLMVDLDEGTITVRLMEGMLDE